MISSVCWVDTGKCQNIGRVDVWLADGATHCRHTEFRNDILFAGRAESTLRAGAAWLLALAGAVYCRRSIHRFHHRLYNHGEGPSRGQLRDYEPSDGTFSSTSAQPNFMCCHSFCKRPYYSHSCFPSLTHSSMEAAADLDMVGVRVELETNLREVSSITIKVKAPTWAPGWKCLLVLTYLIH